MSILRVANVQFNASGTRRIDYDSVADDGIIKVSADAIKLPVGDTASRPNSQAGMIRYNSDLGLFEGANSTAWGSIGGVVDFATANGWANSVGIAGNNYTNYVGASANSWANAVGQNANVYAYATAVSIGGAGNNYTYFSVLPAYNTANAAFASANTKLANATGTFAGSLTTTGSVTSNGYVYVTALDGGQEGGEIQLSGAGNYAGWALDAYQNNHRTFVRTGSTLANVTYFHALGGSVRMGVNKADPLYTLDVNGTLSTSSRGITQASMPAGSILQVQQTFWDGTAVLAASSFTDHPNLSVIITPTSATSKILVMISMQAVVYNQTMQARFTRNGTPIGIAAAASSRTQSTFGGLQTIGDGNHQFTTWNYQHLDSPTSTSALTYKIQLKMQGGSTAYLNRSVNDADNTDWAQRTTSSITVMEIAQ